MVTLSNCKVGNIRKMNYKKFMRKNSTSVAAINESVISGQNIAEEKDLKINWNEMQMHWTSGFVSQPTG
jgi:hypothetical protein